MEKGLHAGLPVRWVVVIFLYQMPKIAEKGVFAFAVEPLVQCLGIHPRMWTNTNTEYPL